MFRVSSPIYARILQWYSQTPPKVLEHQLPSLTSKSLATSADLTKKNMTLYQRSHIESGKDYSLRSIIFLICGVIFSVFHKNENRVFCARAEENPEQQVKRILSLTTGDSEAAIKAERVTNFCTNRDVIIVLGNSKASKSTIVNLLIGNKLMAVLNDVGEIVIVRSDGNDPSTGPIIGLKPGQAETSGPSAWRLSDNLKLPITDLLIDVPGFDDTKGPAQDIANAFYIRQILKKAKTVKIILISDINDVSHDCPKGFVDLINKIHTIFSGSTEILNSTSIVFSKCAPRHIEYIRTYLRRMLDNPDVRIGKELVQHFLNTEDSIGIFARPAKEGPIDISATEKIAPVINGAKAVSLSENKILPGISSDSKVFLHNALSQFTDPSRIAPLTDSIKTFCDKQIQECKEAISSNNQEKIHKIKEILTKLQKESPKPISLIGLSEEQCLKTLESLSRLDPNISAAIRSTTATSLIQLISFVDDVLMSQGKCHWFTSINNKLQYLDSQLNDYIDNTAVALAQISALEAKNKKMQRDHDNALKKAIMERELESIKKWEKTTKILSKLIDLQYPGAGLLLEELSTAFTDKDELEERLSKIQKRIDETKESENS